MNLSVGLAYYRCLYGSSRVIFQTRFHMQGIFQQAYRCRIRAPWRYQVHFALTFQSSCLLSTHTMLNTSIGFRRDLRRVARASLLRCFHHNTTFLDCILYPKHRPYVLKHFALDETNSAGLFQSSINVQGLFASERHGAH